ncbi:MAG: GNAT superfamily N-acetyltransferase [Gammaproteobacteria bacterium]|jgi:GNAT superfamily N-acetyltransferase
MNIELINSEEMDSIIPFLQMSNPNIEKETLRLRVNEMIGQWYQCVGVFEENNLIAMCGLWIITKYYIGKHIEPDNMIVLPEYRSKGLGKKIMQWVYEYGASQGCVASELNCYLPNTKEKLFWINEGYEVIAYHYQKTLLP